MKLALFYLILSVSCRLAVIINTQNKILVPSPSMDAGLFSPLDNHRVHKHNDYPKTNNLVDDDTIKSGGAQDLEEFQLIIIMKILWSDVNRTTCRSKQPDEMSLSMFSWGLKFVISIRNEVRGFIRHNEWVGSRPDISYNTVTIPIPGHFQTAPTLHYMLAICNVRLFFLLFLSFPNVSYYHSNLHFFCGYAESFFFFNVFQTIFLGYSKT